MTRPGPRPYECVRRAWHSDRHQPMRGSLIKEIFRVVSTVHSSATKKNREWQEKLPIVVLKAEEIMYSKANSEAEYMDLKTLWDRTNDAINTIIRRDESTESGQPLHPCIEAALNLGCTPRRASRSQQNNAPRCYLNSSSPEAGCVPWRNLGKKTESMNHTANGQLISHNSNLLKHIDSALAYNPTVQIDDVSTNTFRFSPGNFTPSGSSQKIAVNGYPSVNSSSVYPLHYGDHLQSKGVSTQSKSKSHNTEPGEMNVMQTLSPSDLAATRKINSENPPTGGYDLSLRLGPIAVPSISVENNWPQDMEDAGSSTSHEGSKFSDLTQKDKHLSFLPKTNSDDRLDSCSGRWSSEDENLNAEAAVRKRKAIASHPSEDTRWQPKLPFNYLPRRMSNAGS